MAGRTVTHYEITCDGCGEVRGVEAEHRTAIEARAAVYAEGWRFPPKARMNGAGPSKGQVSDVCPKCLPDWTPQQTHDTWKSRRGA